MKKLKVLPIIVDVSRERLAVSTSANPEPVIFPFAQSMMMDLEVVNREELQAKLQAFVTQAKIKPGPILMVLEESVYFEKNYTGTNSPSMEEVQKFIDTVPFGAVSSKLFKISTGHKLVVINRELYEVLDQIFEKMGYPLMSVVPGFILGQVNAPPKYSVESARVVYRKLDEVLANSFSGVAGEGTFSNKKEAFIEKNKVMVIAISILLIVGCGVTAFVVLNKKPPVRQKRVVTVPAPVVTKVPTPTPETATVSAEMVEKLTAQVLNGSGVPGAAASWEQKLGELGFKNVKTGNGTRTDGVTVTFSKSTPEVLRTLLTSELKKEFSEVRATESAASNFDIVLVIGK